MLAIITTKLPIASRRPSTRDSMIGPQPWARKLASVGLAVIEFHSEMSRIQSAAPLADVGEIEPKTASWRAHHGPMTRRNSASGGHAGEDRDRRAIVDVAPGAPARDARAAPERRSASQMSPIEPARRTPSLRASVASPASRPAIANDRPSPLRPRAVSHSVAGDERMEDREVLGLGHEHGGGARDRGDHAGRRGHDRAGAGVPGDDPRQRRHERADEHAGQGARERRSGRGARRTAPAGSSRGAASGRSRGSAGRRDRAADCRPRRRSRRSRRSGRCRRRSPARRRRSSRNPGTPDRDTGPRARLGPQGPGGTVQPRSARRGSLPNEVGHSAPTNRATTHRNHRAPLARAPNSRRAPFAALDQEIEGSNPSSLATPYVASARFGRSQRSASSSSIPLRRA